MEPSKEAIEAALKAMFVDEQEREHMTEALQAAYAIDFAGVGPIAAAQEQVREKDEDHEKLQAAYLSRGEELDASQREVEEAVGLLNKVARIDKRSINLAEQWESLLPAVSAFIEKEKPNETQKP